MNFFHRIGSFVKRARVDTPADPVRDWLVLLSLSAIALVSIIVWNAWAFDTVSGGGAIGSTTVKAPEVFNQSSLNTIRTIFENRAAEEAKYESGMYTFIDPSQ
ncbi:MAG: hypothetical protein PHV99_01250 [Candidatus Pacebacteria bacterium]|nr:hypothetical protein [Candidatus Paceibacterota bacterium]